MSFTIVEQAPARLNRSELAVPGSSPALFEKAAASAADVVFLDPEDAVAPDAKAQAATAFMIFGVAGIATFLSGNLYHHFGWDVLNLLAVVPVLAVLGATLWLARRRRIAYAMSSAAD